MYVCICHAVTETEVEDVIADGACSEAEVGERTGAGTGCGSCLDRICERLLVADPEHGRVPLRAAV
ncbi:MAG: (2Fe-2S)-binding protein [Actinomycetes bacterium]